MKKTAITLFFLLQAACLFSQIPRPEYPRPQFERTDWINLNGEWTQKTEKSETLCSWH